MELEVRINRLKNITLERIQNAAQEGSTSFIFANSTLLQEIEQIAMKVNEINESLEQLETKALSIESGKFPDITTSTQANPPVSAHKQSANGLSARTIGGMQREKLIEKLKGMGIILIQDRGTIYKTKTGDIVGIAYATERQPGRWFLGLQDREYSSFILLCENEKKEVKSFVFSNVFFKKHKNHFSESKGQLKFNLVKRGEVYQITIPDIGKININNLLDNYEPLKN